MTQKLFVITPTYNEKDNIGELCRKVYLEFNENNFNGGLIVVDDNSPDGTGRIVDELSKKYKSSTFKIVLISRSGKLGYGTAYITGFKKALELDADLIMQIDADFSHPPEKIIEFIKKINNPNVDIVIGSRFVKGGRSEKRTFFRKLLSWGAELYIRTILNLNYRDFTGGFRCYKRKVLEDVKLDEIFSNGYTFQTEMLYRANRKGYKAVEIPFVFKNREKGKSKLSNKVFWEYVLNVPLLRFKKI